MDGGLRPAISNGNRRIVQRNSMRVSPDVSMPAMRGGTGGADRENGFPVRSIAGETVQSVPISRRCARINDAVICIKS
uniref:hypothetical protein n=1 Tax=Burkholderia anthina TaxID=179879 RepID=UPI00158C187F|nr:hypothetical protein [Burkholderia anthina]